MLAGAAVVTTAGVIPRLVVTAMFVGGGALGGFLRSLLSTHFHHPPRRVLLVLPQGVLASAIFKADARAAISQYWRETAGIKALADATSLPPGLAAWMAGQ